MQRSCAALSSVNGTHTDVPFPDTAADGPGPLTFVARSELALEADGPATLLLFEARPVHPPLDAQQHCSPGQVASEMPQASAHHSDVTSGVMLRQSVVGRTDVNVWAACGGWIAKVAAPSNICEYLAFPKKEAQSQQRVPLRRQQLRSGALSSIWTECCLRSSWELLRASSNNGAERRNGWLL